MTEETMTPAATAPAIAPEHAKALLERLIQAYPAAFFMYCEYEIIDESVCIPMLEFKKTLRWCCGFSL